MEYVPYINFLQGRRNGFEYAVIDGINRKERKSFCFYSQHKEGNL